MKRAILFLSVFVFFGTSFVSASEIYTRKPMPFSASVIKSLEEPLGYKGLPVTVDFMIKDTNVHVIYREIHETTLNDLAEFKINIGEGTSQFPFYDEANLSAMTSYCYTVTVHVPGGDVVLMGSDLYGQSSYSINAETAQNANALGNNVIDNTELKIEDIHIFNSDKFNALVNITDLGPNGDSSFIRPIKVHDFIGVNEAPSAVNIDSSITYISLGLGQPFPLLFTNQPVAKLENYFTLCPQDPANFFNGAGVKMPDTGSPYGHSTAAIFGENIHDTQGVGLYGKGFSRGVYAQGLTGILGISAPQTGLNGACVWGYAPTGAGTGNTTYAGLFQDNDQPNTTALGVFGGGFTTKAFNTPSDRRLKRDIRTSALGLDVVMQLQPKQYVYVDNTPYSLPEGVQEGFIAQELEEVLPNLVTDIVFPKSLDPDDMSAGGTETYKGINYTGLIPVLTKALQELNAKVDAQATEIQRLNKEIEKLKEK